MDALCSRDKELSASPGASEWDAPGAPGILLLGGLGMSLCPVPAPHTSQHHGRFGAWAAHALAGGFHAGELPVIPGDGRAGGGTRLFPGTQPLSTAGLGAAGPAGERGRGWKGLRQAKENKSAAGPGWLTSQTTVFDSLLLPCQVQLLPHSHPLAGGARGDVGFSRSGGEGGCRGERQWEGLAPHRFFLALLSFIPLPVEWQEGARG